MEQRKFTGMQDDMRIIRALSDEPNDADGMTAAELKAAFDKPGELAKDAINRLVAELHEEYAAGNIGFEASTEVNATNVQDAIETVQGQIASVQDQISGVSQGAVADNSIGTVKLIDGAVTAEKLAGGAVTATKLSDGAVTTAKLGGEAVTGEKLADNAVTAAKLADSAVSGTKIAPGAVGSTQLAVGAVTAAKIAPGAVTAEKLSDGAVEIRKLGDTVKLVDVSDRIAFEFAEDGSSIQASVKAKRYLYDPLTNIVFFTLRIEANEAFKTGKFLTFRHTGSCFPNENVPIGSVFCGYYNRCVAAYREKDTMVDGTPVSGITIYGADIQEPGDAYFPFTILLSGWYSTDGTEVT